MRTAARVSRYASSKMAACCCVVSLDAARLHDARNGSLPPTRQNAGYVMSADVLLGRLDKVRAAGAGRWMAACPGHNDKSPSLSLRELADGRVLVHCFAGCDASDVLAAVGLTLGDLFPSPPRLDGNKPTSPNHHHAAREALRTLHHEVLIVAIAAENIAAGVALDEADRALVIEAAAKIRTTAEVCR